MARWRKKENSPAESRRWKWYLLLQKSRERLREMPRVSVVCRWWWMAPNDTGDVNCESHSSISRIRLGSWQSVCSVGGDHWLYPLQCNSVGRWSLALCSATVLGCDHWLYPLQCNSVGRWSLALPFAVQQCWEVTIGFILCSATALGGDH